ncbi:MAG: phytanoyl-CoA dioxygenase family protein [Proteobacteria bacterium]|nr:phytanoyl-CoA dioxygenase family protein [Pseudomonadota bacterium]
MPELEVRHLPADSAPEDIAARLAEDGAVVIDKLVDDASMDRLADELAPAMKASRTGPDEFSGHSTRRTGALIAHSQAARELVMNEKILATVGKVLGHATNFQLHLTQIIAIGPGGEAQPVHRDQWAFDFFPFPDGYEVQCNTIWAMTDFTEKNGATRVVPGSHRAGDGRRYELEDTVPATMQRGSVLLYTGSVYHGGGNNKSDATRCGVNITYNLAWLRQEENQYLSVPTEIARELPDDLLRVMGYARGAYALGYVGNLEDPLKALRGEHATVESTGLGTYEQAIERAEKMRAEPLGKSD